MAYPSGANDLASLDGLFKMTYADKIQKLIPEGAIVQNLIKFLPKEKQPGLLFNQPVILQLEHGMTYSDDDDGLVALVDAISGQVKNAQIRGYQMTLRSAIPYTMISRSMGSAQAFESSTKYVVGNMVDSFTKKLEVELMYGKVGIGKVKNSETAGSAVVVEIQSAEWAPGIWGGAENMLVDFYNGASAIATNQQISYVDFDAKAITITTLAANLVAGYDIYPAGTVGGTKQMAGLHKIMTNTGSLFGIDASVYNLWKGTTYTPGTLGTPVVLTFAIIQQAISNGVAKGLSGAVKCLVNPGHWDDLLTEQAALRMYDNSYSSSETENGAKGIKFHSQNGEVEIISSLYVKEGYAYLIQPDNFARVGSMDVTFNRPGFEGKFFLDLPSHNGVELRALSDQALLSVKPGQNILIQNLKTS